MDDRGIVGDVAEPNTGRHAPRLCQEGSLSFLCPQSSPNLKLHGILSPSRCWREDWVAMQARKSLRSKTRSRCSCDTQYSASSESPSPIAVACLWACSLAYTAWALAPALPARALSPADGPPRLSARAASATLAPFFLRVNLADGTSPNPKDPKARSNAGSPPGCAAAGWLGKEAGPREEERA